MIGEVHEVAPSILGPWGGALSILNYFKLPIQNPEKLGQLVGL